ncbi:MAG TPA: amino acid adenylation domain-containing protein, partial [Thermoanaerobaculia bacterium]|nr:amino acid adenylation domain-containing protein [Thermoanaerobaculia bacterium]
RALFDEPTVAGLAQRVAALVQRTGRGRAAAPPLVRVGRAAELALSFAQERLWFIDRLEPGRATYNMPVALAVRGDLSRARVDAVLTEIVRRHEVLRTRFVGAGGRPVQRIAPPRPVRLPLLDLAGLPARRRADAALGIAREDAWRPFDLARSPLLRGALLRGAGRGAGEAVLLLNLHHIVSDGWSTGVLIAEFCALYRAVLAGTPSPLPELPIQYGDFAVWQRRWLDGEETARQLAYWRERLAGAPATLELPSDRPRPAAQSFRGAERSLALAPGPSARLAACGRRHGATIYMTLLAGFAAFLARWTGQEDLVVGTPIANRTRLGVERLIGFFVNTLALRLDVAGDPPGEALLARVREATLAAYAHQDLPFERLVEELRPERLLSQNPLFQAMFALQNAPMGPIDLPGLTLEQLPVAGPTLKFDLGIEWIETGTAPGRALVANLAYATDLFDAATASRLLRHLEALLAGLAADPGRRVSQLPMLSAAERHQLAVEWNDAPSAPGEDVVARFERAAAAAPDAVALGVPGEGTEEWLSYAALDGWAERVAGRLRAAGVGPGTLVAVAASRGAAVYAGLLGTLKAGGAFVPLDPALPRPRLGFMLEDSRAAVVLAEPGALGALPALPTERTAVLRLTPGMAGRADSGLTPLAGGRPASVTGGAAAAAGRGDLAYCMYTSGTTGRPKAVAVERGQLAGVMAAVQDLLRCGPGDRLVTAAPFSFDAFILEMLLPLTAGAAAVVVPSRPALDFERLAAMLPEATVFCTVPGVARQLLATHERRGGGRLPALRHVVSGGDRVPPELIADLQRVCPRAQTWVFYGPTETTILCAAWRAPRALGEARSLLGRPLAGARIELRDRWGNPAPIGARGEIWIGGIGVARGYLERAELTAASYVPLGAAGVGGGRGYRSGDLARQLPDGGIDFLGRVDGQVKLRGFRIETGEVEAVLARHPAVQEAVVALRPSGPGPAGAPQLVAYVVRREAAAPPAAAPRAAGAAGASRAVAAAAVASQPAAAAIAPPAPEAEHVAAWQALYDETWLAGDGAEPNLNFTGWNSSYTGLPIPAAEMREWAEATAERVLALAPRRVLEVGCGAGLLLFRLAAHCESYRGTDFSRSALDLVARELDRPGRALPQVSLSCRPADDWQGMAPGELDLVILNSVVQYFPGVDYLARVLAGAVAALAPGGRVFVGDVRSLPLAEALYTSIELAAAPEGLPVAELRRRVRRRQVDEEELLVAPELWVALARLLPAVSRVEVWKKRGHAVNELTRFRYDVVLTVGGAAPGADGTELAGAVEVAAGAVGAVGGNGAGAGGGKGAGTAVQRCDWRADGVTLGSLAGRLAAAPETLVLTGVPDRRLAAERAVLALLAEPGAELETVGQLRQAVTAGVACEASVDPEELCRLAAGLGYATDLLAAGPGTEGGLRFTAVLRRPGPGRRPAAAAGAAPPERSAPPAAASVDPLADGGLRVLRAHANDPLRGKLARELVPELRRLVRSELPDYMVPGAFVVLDRLPLTAHGKVDRAALPAPDPARPELSASYAAPRTPLEESLAGIWADLLGVERVGVHDNFFELGGHSLLATQVVSRLHDRFGADVPVRTLFEEPTVAGLAERIPALLPRGGGAAPPPVPVGRESELPLSFAQERLWFLDRLEPGRATYNMPLALAVRGDLTRARLDAVLTEIVRRHEALRTRFAEVDGKPVQRIAPARPVRLPLVDLSALPAPRRAVETPRWVRADARRPFDLARGPLLRGILLAGTGPRADEQVLLLNMHHIVSDGWSFGVLVGEIGALYRAALDGSPSPLPELAIQYGDFAVWQRRRLGEAEIARQLAYWRRRLGGAPATIALPTDRPRPPVQSFRGASRVLTLGEAAGERLAACGRRHGATLFMTLLAGFAAFLARWTGADDLVVGTPIANRNHLATERLIGFFVNSLVLRLDLGGDPPAGELLARMRETALDAYAHQDLPFERLVEELRPERELSQNPLFQVMFALQNAPRANADLPGLTLTPLMVEGPTLKFDLELQWFEAAAGGGKALAGTLSYATDL